MLALLMPFFHHIDMSEMPNTYADDLEQPGDAIFSDTPPSRPELEIPLDVRISFSDSQDNNGQWLYAQQIANKLGTYDNNVIRIIAALGIPGEPKELAGRTITVYPTYTTGVVREELEWRQMFYELPGHIRMNTVVERTARSHGWTRKTLHELGVQPTRSELDNGRAVDLYPKGVLKTLRLINMAVPLDNGWYNLGQLVEYTGADREWIGRRLSEIQHGPERRRSSITGKISDFYPPDSVSELMIAIERRASAGGAWLTAHAIGMRVDRSSNWIRRRLGEHEALSTEKQDDHGVTRRHYAPRIVDYLIAESELQRSLPDKGGDTLNIHQVARKLGHATDWAIRILDEIGIEPEQQKDKLGRVRQSYPVSVLDTIRDYERDNPSQGVTVDELLLSLFNVGSLRAQIKLQRDLIDTAINLKLSHDDPQLTQATGRIRQLRKVLRTQGQWHYRLIEKAYDLPGFITGQK